jgi:chorismate dehydratase
VQDRQSLRIGCVKYLNARPLVHGWPGDVALDHPSALCAQLARGELDVALVSSFESLRNPIYRIVNGVSISSDGPVYSVIVAHLGKISDVEEVELDPAAETSGNLLRCLFNERELSPRFVASSTSSLSTRRARLLIGDQAIGFRQRHANEFQFWDLGEQWKKSTRRPFVYALWLVRPEVADPESTAQQLRTLRDENLAHLDQVIADQDKFDSRFCGRYYRKHLRFNFGEREMQGLRTFADLCGKHGLLPKREIAFSLV